MVAVVMRINPSANNRRTGGVSLRGTPGRAGAALVVGACLLAGCAAEKPPPEQERLVISGHEFVLDVADEPSERDRGLGGRTSIPDDGGMLFIFPEPEPRTFWMRDCVFDIDIIFLDAGGRITAMHEMEALPLRGQAGDPNESEAAYYARLRQSDYYSRSRSQFVIELKGGWLDRLDLEVEDKIDLDLERLKARAQEVDSR